MDNSISILQVTTTVDSEELAQELALDLVQKGLAACAQVIGPIFSTFVWHGKFTQETEWQVVVKTTDMRYSELEAYLLDTHPYEMPEIIAVPILYTHDAYWEWVVNNTK